MYSFQAFNESYKTPVSLYYHGADTVEQGELIKSTGTLHAQVTSNTKVHIVGMFGKVYLTPALQYALNFARFNDRRGGAIGYLAVVSGKKVINPVPDEDYIAMVLSKIIHNEYVTDTTPKYDREFYTNVSNWSDDSKKSVRSLTKSLTDREIGSIQNPSNMTISTMSKIGKKLAPLLSDELIELFVSSGSSIACDAPIKYTKLYSFDKKELAEKLREAKYDYSKALKFMQRIK